MRLSRSPRHVIAMIGVSLLLLLPTGYTIAPKVAVHELMTMASVRCLGTGDVMPVSCNTTLQPRHAAVDMRWWDAPDGAPTLEQAVRWPDDPTHQIGMGIVKFGMNLLGACTWTHPRIDVNHGLLCNSHYGQMQFFHAQASDTTEEAIVTHRKIMRWATFLYGVASGRTPGAALDSSYCSAFAGDDAFAKAMAPDGKALPCARRWRVSTLFNLRCRNPVGSIRCTEITDTARSHLRSRIYATGALLHLIQDSYSQSHCVRGECERDAQNRIVAKVECRQITMFTSYGAQRHDDHASADRLPEFAESCLHPGTGIDDPITAGAIALYHIKRGDPTESFLHDFERVVGSAETIARVGQRAGPGACPYIGGHTEVVGKGL